MSPPRPKTETCLSIGTGSAIHFKIISQPRPDHFAFILQTRFSHLPTRFRDIAILFRGVSESFVASFYLSQASAFEEGPKALERIKQGPARSKACKGDSLAARFACGSLALKNGKGTPDRFPTVLSKHVSFKFQLISDTLRPFSDSFPTDVWQISIALFSSHLIPSGTSPA